MNCYTAAANRGREENSLCTKYTSIVQYIKTALVGRAFAIDEEAHAILVRNRVTNLPDRIGVPLDQVLANLWDHYGTLDEAAESKWKTVFDTPRNINDPMLNFLSRWTSYINILNNVDMPCTNHYLISKFKMATPQDLRIITFITELKRLHPGTQAWDQLMDLATGKEANLDGNSGDVCQAFSVLVRRPLNNKQEVQRPQPLYQKKRRSHIASYTASDRIIRQRNAKTLRST